MSVVSLELKILLFNSLAVFTKSPTLAGWLFFGPGESLRRYIELANSKAAKRVVPALGGKMINLSFFDARIRHAFPLLLKQWI